MQLGLFLIVVALVVVGVFYVFLQRQKKQGMARRHGKRKEPKLNTPLVTKTSPQIDQPIEVAEPLFDEGEIELMDSAEPVDASSANESAESIEAKDHPVIVLRLLAHRERPYVGYELLQALLSAGLRFGKMNVFHRHAKPNGQGEILFSLASAVEPGTFEMPKMGSFSCPGLTLFMAVEEGRDNIKIFEQMCETAQQLKEDLGGEIIDQERRKLVSEVVDEWREFIHKHEQRSLMGDLLAG